MLAIMVVMFVDIVWLMSIPHELAAGTGTELLQVFVTAALFALAAYIARTSERLHIFCAGMAILLIAWPPLRIFNHLSLTVPTPLTDDKLAQWDKVLGFDWHAYVDFMDSKPFFIELMATTYTGLTFYTCVLFVALLATRNAARSCSELVGLFVISAILCSAIGMLAPALGPMAYYAPPPGTFAHFGPDTGTYSLPGIFERRSGLTQTFNLSHLPGLTTFPSFHTAMGIIAIYCARRTPWLFAVMLVVNAIMIAGTPIFGSHYLVDLIGGGAIVVVAVAILRIQRGFARRLPKLQESEPGLEGKQSPDPVPI